jgi:spore maturation protein CgeB
VDHYLHAPDDRAALAEAGRLHVLTHHTYEVRTAWVLDRVKQEGLL